jgi:hypothetical protein
MAKLPPPKVVLQLKDLQTRLDALRKEYGISAPHEIVYKADLNSIDDRLIVVVTNGHGGARCDQVRGNFPVDHLVEHSKEFIFEDDACRFANMLMEPEFGDANFELAVELWEKEPSQGN